MARRRLPGLARFEALAGLLHGALSLDGMERHVEPALRALARECGTQIDARGAIATRNPEELLEIFTLLTWCASLLGDAGRVPGTALHSALERIAPTLRGLRHADGGAGAVPRRRPRRRGTSGPGALPVRASAPGRRTRRRRWATSRLHHARTSVIADTAPPPRRDASAAAHASTLAFELTSGRRPLIVNCGDGAVFGESWRRAGRATASHSTLAIEGYSSARLGTASLISGRRAELLIDAPKSVPLERRATGSGDQCSSPSTTATSAPTA